MTRPARILLVEDRRMDVELTLDAFRESRLNNTVDVVSTGELALDFLWARGVHGDRAGADLPDLILLDLKLPGISGHDVLREIKNTPTLRRIPVVVLTSSREESDRALCYDLGVNSFLVKPVSLDAFMDVVRTLDSYWLTLNVGPTGWQKS